MIHFSDIHHIDLPAIPANPIPPNDPANLDTDRQPIIHPTFIEFAIYQQPFQQLSDRHPIYLQWVPSHVGLLGNEVVDVLAKVATSNPVDPESHMVLTSTEIYSRSKELICRTWIVLPVHPWYFQRDPGSVISFKGSRSYQTEFSQFSTGHLRCMNFEGGKRSFPICLKCNISPFSPQQFLQCLVFSCEEAVASPCYSLTLYRFMDSWIWSSETRPDGD
ncbi:RNase H domain-containing protein [Trichonephila clavipes]|nr:RNase H domain-containing protein [Trichonephila clavipes]